MLKSYTAYTREIDDIDVALSEIMEQLDLDGKNPLSKESIGIISCFAEFVDSGVYKALCEKLPFEVVGTTTIANSTDGEVGEMMLTLMVITSDDIHFATALSSPIAGEEKAPLEAMYNAAAAKLDEKPSLMLTFSPLLNNFGSDYYVDTMGEITGGLPNFGTLAVDHNADYHQSAVLYDGEAYRDCFAIVLLQGNVSPMFYIGTISDDKVFPEKGVVTGATGNQLQTVNGMPMMEYLQSLGLQKNDDGTITGINAFPIIVDYNDGTTPVVRAMFALTPEGYAVCGGNIPVGATLSIGRFDGAEILGTTVERLADVLARGPHNLLLMYSCIGRFFSQGYTPLAEVEKVSEMMKAAGIPYMMTYSGGELCPVYDEKEKAVNRNHNNTFIVCAL